MVNALPWQLAASAAVDAATSDKGRMVVAATGSGKTFFGLFEAAPHIYEGKRVLWVAHRQELVRQPLRTFERHWPDLADRAGVLAASLSRRDMDKQITFASRDTLRRCLDEYLAHGYPDLVVVDEAHHAVGASYEWLDRFPRSTVLMGLTATPGRADRRRLSTRWEIVYSYGILDAVKDGVLVQPYAALDRLPRFDYANLGEVGGDYDPKLVALELARAHVVEHTVAALRRSHRALRLPFRDVELVADPGSSSILVFTVTVDQAQRTARALEEAGFRARPVWGEMKPQDRRGILEQFEAGQLDVLCSADALTEGTDLPIAKVCVIARPTKSHTLFVQMCGRVLRKYGDAAYGLIIDLVGATRFHSLVGLPVLVDGEDCPESEDGLHRYLPLESGEGRCHDCGHLIRCYLRGGQHDFKEGRCKKCGATQCRRSPTKEHSFVPWEDHKRVCLHCAIEIPDPLGSMLRRPYYRKESVAWHKVEEVDGTVYAAQAGRLGIMYNVQVGDKWRPYLYTRGKLKPLSPAPVEPGLSRMLTDDVIRQVGPPTGRYGYHNTIAKARVFHIQAAHYARKYQIWRSP